MLRGVLAGTAVALVATGAALVVANFNAACAWLFVGLTLALVGMFCANMAFHCWLARNLDEEFSAGYRVGYRAGRRAPMVPQPVADLDMFRTARGGRSGGVSQASVRPVAGHRPTARRPTTHAN